MGIGPWAQADLIRDVERRERARFRRIVSTALNKEHMNGLSGVRPCKVLEGILEKITPKPRKSRSR